MILNIFGNTINFIFGFNDFYLRIRTAAWVNLTTLLLFFENWSFSYTNRKLNMIKRVLWDRLLKHEVIAYLPWICFSLSWFKNQYRRFCHLRGYRLFFLLFPFWLLPSWLFFLISFAKSSWFSPLRCLYFCSLP